MSAERWSRGGYARTYSWAQCRYCGRAQNHDCARVECLLCGSPQCFGNGSGNGHCAICHVGYLPGWSRIGRAHCSRRGCESPAVAVVRKRTLCLAHATTAKITPGQTVAEYVTDKLALRDAGKLMIGFTPWKLVP
jgi:hypothetical protein